MATEKTLKTRVKMKHGKESEWKLATNFTPLIGEIIVYDADNNHTSPRLKIGDGSTKVNNLPFVISALTNDDIDAICGSTIQSASEVTF